jgi:hypothetical protein
MCMCVIFIPELVTVSYTCTVDINFIRNMNAIYWTANLAIAHKFLCILLFGVCVGGGGGAVHVGGNVQSP